MKPCFLLISSFLLLVEGTDIKKTLHNGNNQLTSRMFAEVVKKNQNKSVVLSAFSVITPLSQLAVASEGPSHDELLNAVGFPDENTTNAVFALIDVNFQSIEGVQLKQASKLYIPLGYQVHEQFATVSKDVYHSEIANIDFTDSQNASKEINLWVEDQTNHRIKDLVDPGSIDSGTLCVLVNALYFKGSWRYPFMKLATNTQDFYVNKQKTVKIAMMHNTEMYKYIESERLRSKVLELPYAGDESSFLVILPNDIDGIDQLIKQLKDPNILDEETSEVWYNEVRVSMPKFKIETTTDLKETLININVTKLFGSEANLNKLLKNHKGLYISQATQKAFIEINEEGAEAAAANAFLISEAGFIETQTYDFVADHPFAFFLRVRNDIIFNGVFYG